MFQLIKDSAKKFVCVKGGKYHIFKITLYAVRNLKICLIIVKAKLFQRRKNAFSILMGYL